MINLSKTVKPHSSPFRRCPFLLAAIISCVFSGSLAAQEDIASELKSLREGVIKLRNDENYPEAIKLAKRAVQVLTENYGEIDFKTAVGTEDLAYVYECMEEYEKAIPLYLRSLRILEEIRGKDSVDVAITAGFLAEVYEKAKNYDEAEKFYLRSLAIRDSVLGKDHEDTVRLVKKLARFYRGRKRWDSSEIYFRRLVEDQEGGSEIKGDVAPTDLLSLAFTLTSQGKYKIAEKYYLLALPRYEEKFGLEDAETAGLLNMMAVNYSGLAEYHKAEEAYKKAFIIRKGLGEEESFPFARLLGNLGTLQYKQGKYDEAEQNAKESIRILESLSLGGSVEIAPSLQLLGQLAMVRGDLESSEEIFMRCLSVYREEFGETSPKVGEILNSLAVHFKAKGDLEEALRYGKACVEIWTEKLGEKHPDTIVAVDNLAQTYLAQGLASEAKELVERSLVAFEENLGTNHPSTATCLNNLGSINRELKDYDEAEKLFTRAYEILEVALGKGHERSLICMENLVSVKFAQGGGRDIEPLVSLFLVGAMERYEKSLRFFPEVDCIETQKSFPTSNLAGSLGDGELSALEQIRFKGCVLETISERRISESRLIATEDGRALLNQRKGLEDLYRKMVLSLGDENENVREIEEKLRNLEREIVAQTEGGTGFVAKGFALDDLRKVLRSGEVLVEAFRYNHYLVDDQDETWYSSVIIRRDGEAEYVPLAKAFDLEAAMYSYRATIEKLDPRLEREDLRKKVFEGFEKMLYAAFLEPIDEELNPGETVIFSLDSQLHFIPVGMIRDSEGVPFGQKYKARYVTSGRDLVKEVTRNRDGKKSALVLGNPSYRDNQPLLALAEAQEEAEREVVASNLRAGIQNEAGSITLTPLPGTAREIASLKGKLESDDYSVTTLSQGEATEEALEEAIYGHDIVHLATHGFFLSEIERETNPQDGLLSLGGSDQQTPVVISDPMYRSGLALAGAQSTFNLWKEGKVPPPSKDGILLAAEANLLNLRGTDLVVLSACETASGEALDGEGVMGLRRAFASAGANNTIMTLWPVNDEATVEVMEAFYDKYLAGIHPAIALAEVQNELYQPFVEKYGEVEAIARLAPFVCMSLGRVE